MPTHRKFRTWLWMACLVGVGMTSAGEIIILQPAPAPPASEARDEARRAAGKPVAGQPTILLVDPASAQATGRLINPLSPEERSRREAREYLDPPPVYHDEGTVILRAAPLTEAEKSRLRARSAVAPAKPAAAASDKNCTASSEIGTIGEGAGAVRGNVSERGVSSVNISSSCR